MRAKQLLVNELQKIAGDLGLPWSSKITLEPPRDAKFGDLAVNMAMVLAKESGKNPRELAGEIADRLKSSQLQLSGVEIAGPGFINVRFSPEFWRATVQLVLAGGGDYGKSHIGRGKKVQVEYVSANPTGPLHIGHGRGAAIGDSLARIMRFAGYDVDTEYYINDAGRQMSILGLSVWLRAGELAGQDVEWPKDGDWYKGEYIIDIARDLMKREPDLLSLPEDEARNRCFDYAMGVILQGIKDDLAAFRVEHRNWFSERTLVQDGSVDKAFALLRQNGHIYEKDGAVWFRATELGDEKDRVLKKSDGSLTYFASDIAYHANKYTRGYDLLVDIWGADHHGYIARMRAAVSALGKAADSFDVILVQLVNLMQNGEQIAMSTRAGKFETLIDVINEVGSDAARFMFLSRKSDSPLDFDLELVKERTRNNPVFYVQYAYARICTLRRRAGERNLILADENSGEFSANLVEEAEVSLLRRLDAFPELVASAAESLSPHHVSFYLMDLAKELHAYYDSTKVLDLDDVNLSKARLYLLAAIGVVLKNGLNLLGVEAPESM